jgi:hypothetical protein
MGFSRLVLIKENKNFLIYEIKDNNKGCAIKPYFSAAGKMQVFF